jgi:hypothetical protein
MNRFGSINPHDPSVQKAIRGGIPLQKQQNLPVLPWDAFVGYGVGVWKDEKKQMANFEPQPMSSDDEVVETLRLLIVAAAALDRRPALLDWSTVPEAVQQHFRVFDPKETGGGTEVAEQ